MSPLNKRFLIWNGGVITGREAIARYPNPKFFMRGRPSLSMDECRDYLRRNADEAAELVQMLRHNSSFKSKAPILHAVNKLHDFRVSIGMHGGEAGRPYLWEE